MAPLLARNALVRLAVEPLEDRRLLSHFGQTSGWSDSSDVAAPPVAMPPTIWGPMLGSGSVAKTTGSDRGALESQAAMGSSLMASGFDRASTEDQSASSSALATGCSSSTSLAAFSMIEARTSALRGWQSYASSAASSAPVGASANPVGATIGASLGTASWLDSRNSGGAVPPVVPSPAASISAAPRGPSLVVIPHAVDDLIQTSRVDKVTSDDPASLGHPLVDDSRFVGMINPPVAHGINLETPARGALALPINLGQGSLDPSSGLAINIDFQQSPANPWSSVGSAPTPSWPAGVTENPSRDQPPSMTRTGGEFEVPDPQMADLILSLLPFDQTSMKLAVAQILEPLDSLSVSMPELRGPMGLVSSSLTVAITVLTMDIAIRIRRTRQEQGETDGDESLVPFPGLPGYRRWTRS